MNFKFDFTQAIIKQIRKHWPEMFPIPGIIIEATPSSVLFYSFIPQI